MVVRLYWVCGGLVLGWGLVIKGLVMNLSIVSFFWVVDELIVLWLWLGGVLLSTMSFKANLHISVHKCK